MKINHEETHTRIRSNKTLSSDNSKQSIFTQISSQLENLKKFLLWIINKIFNFLSKFSMRTHFIIIIIPISILFIFLLFFIHIKFYEILYRFNYYKGVKEEFLDIYITEIDDLHSEFETFLIKASYLDLENILFFEIYFRELISIGLLDNSSEIIFPDIHYESEVIYKDIDLFYLYYQLNCEYSIKKDEAENYIDKRNDSLKELAKIYFYSFPIINYGVHFNNIFIEKSHLIAYEFDNDRNIIGNKLYFTFPKSSSLDKKSDNFHITHGYLNPIVNKSKYEHLDLINNSYFKENFFEKQDNDFRFLSFLDEEFWSYISFNHLNSETNGNISKTLMISLQLNINRNNRHFMINNIVNLKQNNLIENSVEYTAFILRNNNITHNNISNKYSDNETFVISQQEITEYSLSSLDTQYFHYGLYDKNYNFFKNGVSFDSFNLNLLSNPLKYYSTINGFNYDLKYLTIFFLYTQMFQNIVQSNYKKEGEEISLNIFSDEEKVKNICRELNLTNYIEYIKTDTEIDCWDLENKLYYQDDYADTGLFDSYTSLPSCSCLPLYCLDNFENLKEEKYKFSENNLVSKINLPDRCQPKFDYYSKNSQENIESYKNTTLIKSDWVFYLFNTECKIPEKKYIKIEKEDFSQIPGYYILVFSEIKSDTQSLFYIFYNINHKVELIFLTLIILFFIFMITIIIIYINLKKISLIIEEFTQKYEIFVYHSKCNDIDVLHQQDNNNNNKINNHNNENENMPLLQNNNSLINELYNDNNYLIEDLFSLYCKYYNICNKTLEKLYSKKAHQTKYQMKLKMMTEKNELFKLLCMFSIYAPFFRLNIGLDYKMYKYSKIIKKYEQYVNQVGNLDKNQTKLTKNILYELLSTENISDYGLVMNLNFKYISNINAEKKDNSIQNALFINIINKLRGKKEENEFENDINMSDILFIKDGDERQNVKLIIKKKNELMELFKNRFESDDYLNYNKIESSFNFFLINSYYKYLKQISLEEENNTQ